MPGDIKYADLNNDGVINEYDRTYIGNPTIPQLVYGFGASVQYKNWDFSIFFQGIDKVSIYMQDIYPFGTYHKNVLGFVADSYWSESDPDPNATFPRLAHTVGFENNQQLSTYWLRNGAFLRLKNAEIGYTIPEKVVKAVGLESVRVFVNGLNLLCFDKIKIVDPEVDSGTGNYPQQRAFNIGFQINF